MNVSVIHVLNLKRCLSKFCLQEMITLSHKEAQDMSYLRLKTLEMMTLSTLHRLEVLERLKGNRKQCAECVKVGGLRFPSHSEEIRRQQEV